MNCSHNRGVTLSAIVSDSPARSFMKQIKCHTGYFACDFCIQHGKHRGTRKLLPSSFTDESEEDVDDGTTLANETLVPPPHKIHSILSDIRYVMYDIIRNLKHIGIGCKQQL